MYNASAVTASVDLINVTVAGTREPLIGVALPRLSFDGVSDLTGGYTVQASMTVTKMVVPPVLTVAGAPALTTLEDTPVNVSVTVVSANAAPAPTLISCSATNALASLTLVQASTTNVRLHSQASSSSLVVNATVSTTALTFHISKGAHRRTTGRSRCSPAPAVSVRPVGELELGDERRPGRCHVQHWRRVPGQHRGGRRRRQRRACRRGVVVRAVGRRGRARDAVQCGPQVALPSRVHPASYRSINVSDVDAGETISASMTAQVHTYPQTGSPDDPLVVFVRRPVIRWAGARHDVDAELGPGPVRRHRPA